MQSNLDQRVLYYDDSAGTWTDLTIEVNDALNGTYATIDMDPEDFLYISSFLPFNHKYLKFQTPSDTAIAPKIEFLSGRSEWSEVVDMLDYTNKFQISGVLQWTRNWDKSWGRISNSQRDVDAMSTGPTIYDAYWLRISFPSDPKSFALEYVGQLFSSDFDLYAEYPTLQKNTILAGWKAGKTNWLEQHILAANYIGKELIRRNLVLNNNQILDIATLRSPAVHKAAHIIYSGLGAKNYEKEITNAAMAFEEAMKLGRPQIDANADALKTPGDVLRTTSRLSR